MTTNISFRTALSAHDLKIENTRDEIFDFILELDAAIGEADFTERLILRLATDLAGDSKTSEIRAIGQKIIQLEGYEP